MTIERAIQKIDWLKLNAPWAEGIDEALSMATEALEKQVPKRTYPFRQCPKCNAWISFMWRYCPYCGQKIKTEDDEEAEKAQENYKDV